MILVEGPRTPPGPPYRLPKTKFDHESRNFTFPNIEEMVEKVVAVKFITNLVLTKGH